MKPTVGRSVLYAVPGTDLLLSNSSTEFFCKKSARIMETVFTLHCKADKHGKANSGKFTVEQALKVQRGSTGIVIFVISELDGGGWSTLRPGRFYPR